MAYQPVPELPDDTAENVPRVMGVRADDSLALAPAGLPLTGGTLTGNIQTPTTANTGAPSYTFTGATGAGMWCYSNDLLGFAVSGTEFFRADSSTATFKGSLHVDGTITGTVAFTVAEDIGTADLLERAETATMPALDDDGGTITVNEVITALMLKVKELSARIETMEQQ